jgi:hypothetical protein
MRIKHLIALSMIFMSAMACSIPTVNQPAPIDKNTLSTIIAQTANAATTQTAIATAQASLTPTPLPVNETSIEKLPDGSVKFTHISGGYEVVYPVGWLVLRPDSEEFTTALAKDAAKNSMLQDQMNMDMSTYEAGYDQLYSYALRPDLEKNVIFGFSKVGWQANETHPMNENSMGELVREIESSGAIPGFRLDTAQIYENSNLIKMIEIGGQFTISDGQDGIIPFYTTVVYFKPVSDTLVRLSFTYIKDFKLDIQGDVTLVVNSVKLLEQ